MKKLYLFAALAAMLAACSENDLTAEKQVVQQNAEEGAVLFDSYVNRPTTRSGDNGTITLQTDNTRKLQDTGFGVFGFYTDDNDYDGQSLPNFMYNEKISYDDESSSSTYKKWIYNPVKYWPNEYGNSAIADDADKVSFFAYAPYVQVTPNTGKAEDQTYGITQLSRNSLTGDPYVKYIASFDWTKNVDLLWGVCDDPSWAIVAGEAQQINNGAKGLPWLNVQRPKEAATQAAAEQRVKFNFRHALSQLNVTVDYDADIETHTDADGNKLADNTRVYVRSVTFTGFSTRGALNLNNTQPNTPLWMGYDAISDLDTGEETTIYDGRKDGKEGSSSASNEKNAYLNPALVQTTAWNNDNKGVENKAQNLFAFPGSDLVATAKLASPVQNTIDATPLLTQGFNEALGIAGTNTWDFTDDDNAKALLNWPVLVIPNGDEVTITIVYDVETKDGKLATTVSDGSTKGSTIENRITKTITFSKSATRNYMEAGKKYIINLHLGLNSVKFEANVEDWGTIVEGENWFPANKITFQAPGVYDYIVKASATTTEKFDLTGFSPNETRNIAKANTSLSVNCPASANAAGQFNNVTFTGFAANTSVVDVTTPNALTFTGVTSGKEVVLNLVQLAAQPVADGSGTNKSTLTISGNTATIHLADGTNDLTGAVWKGTTRNVTIVAAYRNGYLMTEVPEAASLSGTALQFCCDTATDAKIWLGTAAQKDETFTFIIKAGDAGEVTLNAVAP